MESKYAIKHLEQYIKTISKKANLDARVYKGSGILVDERIQSAMEQIELYRIGKGRLQNTGFSA